MPVGENSRIVAFEECFDMPAGHSRVYFCLARGVAKDSVEREPVLPIVDHRVIILKVGRMDCWSKPAVDSDVLALVFLVGALEIRVLVDCAFD